MDREVLVEFFREGRFSAAWAARGNALNAVAAKDPAELARADALTVAADHVVDALFFAQARGARRRGGPHSGPAPGLSYGFSAMQLHVLGPTRTFWADSRPVTGIFSQLLLWTCTVWAHPAVAPSRASRRA